MYKVKCNECESEYTLSKVDGYIPGCCAYCGDAEIKWEEIDVRR